MAGDENSVGSSWNQSTAQLNRSLSAAKKIVSENHDLNS